MKFLFVLFVLGITLSAKAQVQFNKSLSWKQLRNQAKAEHKYIFVDVMATWCGPCKGMDENVYPNAKLAKFINENYLSVKVQTNQTSKDDEYTKSWYQAAKEIQANYQVTGLPSMVFLTPDGELAHKTVGYRNSDELLADAKLAMDPANQYSVLLNQYANDKTDTAFVNKLAKLSESMGRKVMASKLRKTDAISNLKAVPVKIPVSLLGTWIIDYPKCEFGPLPLKVASKQITVIHSAPGIRIERLAKDDQDKEYLSTEKLMLNGKATDNPTAKENRIKRSLLAPLSIGRGFIEMSEITFPNSKIEINYLVKEKWLLNESQDQLTIEKTVDNGDKPYTVTLIYNKQQNQKVK